MRGGVGVCWEGYGDNREIDRGDRRQGQGEGEGEKNDARQGNG